MQTTQKIPGDSATTYAQYLTSTASRGDYYASDGEPDHDRVVPSRWFGSQRVLSDLGLSADRPVDRRDLRAVMNGYSPVTKEVLRPAGSDGTRTAGIELMMAPPKTVSALWATSDPYRRAQIEAAHRKAVASALRRTEREVALLRRKTNGVVRYEKAKSLLAAEFVHTSSRLAQDQDAGGIPDPQLHSHLLLFAAERKDGKLAAIESKQLYRSARENGAWYRAELAHNLAQLGLQIDRRTGENERYFELAGVPHELAQRWSSRSEDVDRAAKLFRARYGREPRAGELGSLTTSTRGSKSAAAANDVNDAWRAQGEEYGLNKDYVEGLFDERTIENQPPVDLREELLTNVTSESSMITTHELKAKAYELSAGVCRPGEADRLLNDLTRSGELLQLEDGTWTTRQLRELEQTTIDIAQQRASEIAAPVKEQTLKRARREIAKQIKGSLTQEQREALERITGPGGIAVLVGAAGTGKGVVISTATRAWQLEGTEVIGTSVAGATAQRLQADANLYASYSADELIYGIQQDRIKIGPDTVIVFDEAAMADHERIAPLLRLTAERGAKPLLVGDAAQLSTIGPGGLFATLQDKVPTAELHEVHRANHEWERTAWQQIRAGEPGPALAQYQAHDRLHIHDTRAQAAEAMVQNWDETRQTLKNAQAVMITDASNKERDQINAMAQERRAQAGELGAHTVELPGKPYGLRAGDQIIFTAKYPLPGQERIKNGITATVIDTNRDEPRVTIKTNEHEPREVQVDTSKFSDLSLSYAVHVNKAQGITTETSGILIGSWQTDKEHAYVTVSRAREETQIHVSREDLGEQGLDTGAMERLAEKMKRSRAQQATITKNIADRSPERQQTAERENEHPQPERASERLRAKRRPQDRVADEDGIVRDPSDLNNERHREKQNSTVPQTERSRAAAPIDIRDANPNEVQITVVDQGDTQLAYSNVYDLKSHTGEPTYALFGGWQTDKTLGYVAAVQHQDHTQTYITTEDRHDRNIETELGDRIGQVIERSQAQQANPAPQADPTDRTNTPEPDQGSERHAEQPAELQPGEPAIDPEFQQIIQDQQDRQQDWEQGIEPGHDNDLGYGIA
jgi:conjugative relaxase-like TrwC/TraI family protein